MKNEKMPENIVPLVLYVVALAMGIVSIVLNVLGESVDLIILAIGMTALGLAGVITLQKK
ncbi:MAG: hypothetical protein ACXAAI_13630 [Promethearchaeota archaeon]|jgi:hypothetical protein